MCAAHGGRPLPCLLSSSHMITGISGLHHSTLIHDDIVQQIVQVMSIGPSRNNWKRSQCLGDHLNRANKRVYLSCCLSPCGILDDLVVPIFNNVVHQKYFYVHVHASKVSVIHYYNDIVPLSRK